MPPKKGLVARPLKSSEFAIEHVTSQAATGWCDIVATQKSSAVYAWERLTKAPNQSDPKCHQLKGQLATIVRDGVEHDQWQYELSGGARIWFYVEGRTVKIVNVFTRHPTQTK
jgi:hypothetical protein